MAFPVIRLHESTNRQEFMVNILVMWCGSEPVVCWLGIHIICDGSVNVKREDMYIYTYYIYLFRRYIFIVDVQNMWSVNAQILSTPSPQHEPHYNNIKKCCILYRHNKRLGQSLLHITRRQSWVPSLGEAYNAPCIYLGDWSARQCYIWAWAAYTYAIYIFETPINHSKIFFML